MSVIFNDENQGEKLNFEKEYTVMGCIILCASFIITALIRLYRIVAPLSSDIYHYFRTSETAIVIQNFFREGFSFFHSSMPVFGKPWSLMFEFPLYQAIVYFVMRLTGGTNIDYWGRLVSICIFYCGAVVLLFFAKRLLNIRCALLVEITYLWSAFNLYWSRAILIDFLSVFLGLAYGLIFYKYLKNMCSRGCYFLGIFLGIAGYLTKVTSMFPIVFLLACLIVEEEIKILLQCEGNIICKIKKYLSLYYQKVSGILALAIIPVIFGWLWTRYADLQKDASVYTKWLTSKGLSEWNYGTLQQRMVFDNWRVILDRYVAFWGNGWVIIAITVIYLAFTKRKYIKLVSYLFIAQFMTIFVLFNLFFVHNYYLIAITPFVYLMFGIMIYELLQIKTDFKVLKSLLVFIGCFVLLFFQYDNNRDYLNGVFHISMEKSNMGDIIQRIIDDETLLIVADEDWNPRVLYEANRRGFMILREQKISEDEALKSFLDDDDYELFYSHSVIAISDYIMAYKEIRQYLLPIEDSWDGELFAFLNAKVSDDCVDRDYANEYLNDEPYVELGLMPEDGIVKLTYEIESDFITDVEIVDENGQSYYSLIAFPAVSDHIYLDLSYLCEKPLKMRINLDKEIKVVVSY